ncbi:hypothetical protein [Streptosporangium sp. NPDC023615]|uniref:hypothetical protein n=1 Tax=Streptosporangium sp. NPDC023615 TaxID=3154794 RepID=UPI003441D2B5
MNFCLSDLVPPLRWSDAATIPLLRDQPDLPDAWWRSLPVARVLAVLGPERLAEVLTTIALEHWPAAAVGDVLPALHVLDPEDADEPCTAIALDRAGSWPGLLALTGHDLRDQPFIQPVQLLHTLFTAVLTRLVASAPADPAGSAGSAARGAAAPVRPAAVESGPVQPVAVQPVAVQPVAVQPVAQIPEPRTGMEESGAQAAPEAPEALEAPETPGVAGVAEVRPAPEPQAPPGPSETVKAPETPETPEAPDAPEAPEAPEAPAEDHASGVVAARDRAADVAADIAAAQDSRDRDAEDDAAPGSLFRPAAARRSRTALEGEAGDGGRPGAELGGDAPEDRLWAAPGPGGAPHPADAVPGPVPLPEAEVLPEAVPEALPEPEAPPEAVPEPEAGAVIGDTGDDRDDRDDDRDDDDGEGAEPVGGVSGRPETDLHALVDGVFANVEDKRWAVAQNRLFSDVPATVEALAKLFAVQPDVIRDLEADLRRELAEWIASDEAAPYREHLEAVKDVLGKAAPRERLVDAAEWHTRELRSLDVPAWQFVLACLPGYHLVDEWLVEGDITELRHRTRDMISGAKPPLTINKALDMVSSLGIHPEVSQEWLENVPQLRILGAGERPPQRAGGAPALTVEKPGDGAGGRDAGEGGGGGGGEERDAGRAGRESGRGEPARGEPDHGRSDHGGPGRAEPGEKPAKAPFRPLKDVSLTRRCFRQPDGRWWLRIDVTADHLRGNECPLPSGFAAYLGMAPGTTRTVSSAVGELALNWQDRPVLESLGTLLADVGAKEGSHLFLTLSDEGVLRARHLPAAGDEIETTARALRLVGYTAAGGTPDQAVRVIATRVGMSGPAALPDLLTRLRERGDRDLLSLLA